MVRSYERHGPTQAFGVITSPTANSVYDGRYAYVPAWEDVLVWDVKKGEQVSMWHSTGLTSPVSVIAQAPSPSTSSSQTALTFAVSYQDGSIRLWSFPRSTPEVEPTEIVTFNGHKKGVTCLSWDAEGSRLASGGTEGEIVVWDRVAEVGLFRLKGHRAPVTSIHWLPHPTLSATSHPGYLVSTSKDTYLKVWDLSTQHCVQTVVVGRGEVWCSAIKEEEAEQVGEEADGEETRGRYLIVTGSGDGEAKAWTIEKAALARGMAENEKGELPSLAHHLCNIPLPSSNQPISQLSFHATLPLILLQTSDRATTVLRIRSLEEVAAKRARRKKREKEKGKKKGGKAAVEDDEDGAADPEGAAQVDDVKWEERLTSWCVVRANAKVRSFCLPSDNSLSVKGDISLMLALSNNSIEAYSIPTPSATATKASKLADGSSPEPSKTHSIELPGHRSDVRTLCISSDDQLIASAANGTLKIWNARTTACIRTMECGYAICSTFLPGDRHLVVGTKAGELLLYDIAASTLLATYKAHSGPVWSVHVRPDPERPGPQHGLGLVSGSADKDVKFWEWAMGETGEEQRVVSRLGVETVYRNKQLELVHTRTLKMTDDVLAVRYSPDAKFLAVSLLDSTVKIFFSDSLKFYLSLYGHKLPVLALDISGDSKLIATCSADKNVKLWGMDFGDCHRSLFAHDDSIMSVQFEKKRDSHLFCTVGMVKYWDGDKFELIQKLEGHHGEVWTLATSYNGGYVVTGSHDKSIRIWERTEEPLFLEEERERELEAMYDSNIADSMNKPGMANGEDGENGGDDVEAVRKQTSETLMAGERIMEAIELADAERETIRQWEEDKAKVSPEEAESIPKPPKNPELVALGNLEPEEHVLKTLQKVPAAQMEDALLVLPFRIVVSLLDYLDHWARADKDIILTSRLLAFLLRTNHAQIVSNRIMRTRLLTLRDHVRSALSRQRETIGYNLAALKFLKARWESEKMAGMMVDEMADEDKVREKLAAGRAKRKRVGIAA